MKPLCRTPRITIGTTVGATDDNVYIFDFAFYINDCHGCMPPNFPKFVSDTLPFQRHDPPHHRLRRSYLGQVASCPTSLFGLVPRLVQKECARGTHVATRQGISILGALLHPKGGGLSCFPVPRVIPNHVMSSFVETSPHYNKVMLRHAARTAAAQHDVFKNRCPPPYPLLGRG